MGTDKDYEPTSGNTTPYASGTTTVTYNIGNLSLESDDKSFGDDLNPDSMTVVMQIDFLSGSVTTPKLKYKSSASNGYCRRDLDVGVYQQKLLSSFATVKGETSYQRDQESKVLEPITVDLSGKTAYFVSKRLVFPRLMFIHTAYWYSGSSSYYYHNASANLESVGSWTDIEYRIAVRFVCANMNVTVNNQLPS